MLFHKFDNVAAIGFNHFATAGFYTLATENAASHSSCGNQLLVVGPSEFATIGGGIWLVWGVVTLAGGLKDQNGPQLQSGIWQCLGGGLIIAAAVLFKSIAV